LQDNKERQKNLAEAVKVPVKVDEMTGLGGKATNSIEEVCSSLHLALS